MSKDNKQKLTFLYNELCSCLILKQYLDSKTEDREHFRHCKGFFFTLMQTLAESLIVRLYAIIETRDDTLNISQIYEDITGDKYNLKDEFKIPIFATRCDFVGHKKSEKNLQDGVSDKAIIESLQIAQPLLEELFKTYSELDNKLNNKDSETIAMISSPNRASFIDVLALGSAILDDDDFNFESNRAGDIKRQIRLSSRQSRRNQQ